MPAFARRPAWIALHVVVIAITVAFVLLGRWQLARLDERRTGNEVIAERLQAPVVEWNGDAQPPEYTRIRLTGEFDPEDEVFLRSQVYLGQPGFDVLTPLHVAGGSTVLINRGWVPLEFERPPAGGAAPPAGTIVVTGLVRYPAAEPPGGGGEPPVVSGFDFDALDRWVDGTLERFYVALSSVEPTGGELPVPEAEPEPSDGPHLSYALQWFAFALIAVVGYGALIRSTALRRAGVRRRGAPRPPR